MAHELCEAFLGQLRHAARFALHLSETPSALPHAQELKLQHGGLLGLQATLEPDTATAQTVPNVYGLLSAALTHYHTIEDLPYASCLKAIASFKGRARRSHASRADK